MDGGSPKRIDETKVTGLELTADGVRQRAPGLTKREVECRTLESPAAVVVRGLHLRFLDEEASPSRCCENESSVYEPASGRSSGGG